MLENIAFLGTPVVQNGELCDNYRGDPVVKMCLVWMCNSSISLNKCSLCDVLISLCGHDCLHYKDSNSLGFSMCFMFSGQEKERVS